ncbi:RNA 2',3'-cyclic phosphodiesterase [candidate division KSB1 bacterium]|nr:RNA 2',3'-cyclic phosphodiesterase [candidate division KSB1 bacterium]
MPDIRTFICFEIPVPIKERIVKLQNELRSLGRGVRWVNPDGIHLTLKFLGDVQEKDIVKIAEAVKTSVNGFMPVKIKIANTGAFPNFKRPRVIWIGVEEPTGQLVEIHRVIEQELEKLEYEKENRNFSPHLTLGRIKSSDGIEKITNKLSNREINFGEFTAVEIIIMKSELKPSGAVYTPLFKIEL